MLGLADPTPRVLANGSSTGTTPLLTAQVKAAPTKAGDAFFDAIVSELNPLQYIPVVGTVYRAVTGDTISEPARAVGSLVVSGLTGGPIGVAINIAMLAAEKLIGFDPEAIGQKVLASVGIARNVETSSTATGSTDTPAATPVPPTLIAYASEAPAAPWSAVQLSAYGVTVASDGTLQRGALSSSDVLNDLELLRHGSQFADATSRMSIAS